MRKGDEKMICNNIIEYLGGEKIFIMLKNVLTSKNGNVTLKYSNCKNKSNCCVISYNGNDLYDMVFYFNRGTKCEWKGRYNDVIGKNLKELFEEYTSIYLSL
jgi:hypothetical protein